ncbi:hypothetical protein HOLleu_16829 [Holothuria leucospilota]|uniref:Uncharacterized protein n=1 Tax=Holothuria leucospilota TaxID=206669 RepID=A0A9Q1C692_HOLLE|nr:hypothetical protein HOLleu_16829 [Holothuria leucospilota]
MMLVNFLYLIVGQTDYNDTKKQSGNLNDRFDALALLIVGGSVYAFSKDISTLMESVCCIALVLTYFFFYDVLTTTSLWVVLMYGVLAGNALVAIKKLPAKSKD